MASQNKKSRKMAEVFRNYHKVFVCRCLAEFMAPAEVARAFAVEYAGEFPGRREAGEDTFLSWIRDRVKYYAYDPKAHEWQKLTREMRELWLEDVKAIPLANVRMRVQELAKRYGEFDERLRKVAGHVITAEELVAFSKEGRAILDQIAEEAGEKIERQKIDLKGGMDIYGYTDTEATIRAAEGILAGLGRRRIPEAPGD